MDNNEIIAEQSGRSKRIMVTGAVSIAANVLLAAFKAVIGALTGSIAITLDAVNNVSDAGSGIITVVGTRLSAKQPDSKHPFGHGRAEYLSALLISGLVLYAGLTSAVESVKKIVNPEAAEYSTVSLIIVAIAVIVKIVLGLYVRKTGKAVDSDSLVNSGTDALLDSIVSFSTLVAAGVQLIWGIGLEAYLGAAISLIIIKSGVDMLKDTVSRLLGERADEDLAKGIKATISAVNGVQGVYDLVLNDYGPEYFQGSVHIEVEDKLSADEVDVLTRVITEQVYLNHKVILAAVGVYSINTTDSEIAKARNAVKDTVFAVKGIIGFHGFHMDKTAKTMRFDLVVDFDCDDRVAVYSTAIQNAQSLYPEYKITATLDSSFA